MKTETTEVNFLHDQMIRSVYDLREPFRSDPEMTAIYVSPPRLAYYRTRAAQALRKGRK